LKSCCDLQDHYDDQCDKTVFHNTTPDLLSDHSVQHQDQDRLFWYQTGLVLTGRLHGTIVGPTAWSVRRSYRVNASFDRSDRRRNSEESNMFDFVRLPIRLSKRVDTTSDWSDRPAIRTTNHAAAKAVLVAYVIAT